MNVNMLRAAMALKGVKIGELADAIGISRSALFRRMRGKSQFKLDEIRRIKQVLGLDGQSASEIFF